MAAMRIRHLIAAALAILSSAFAPGDEPARAARSVHLSYLPPSDDDGYLAFCNECTIERSVPGSYFQACGFAGGYFGVQELDGGNKVAIFSVWDRSKGDDAARVKDRDRVEMVYVGDGVRAQRFGGEGTGAQSFFDYDWQVGKRIRFFVEATAEENKTAYAAYIQLPDGKTWKHLATFRTRSGDTTTSTGKPMNHLYAFIEDFRRDTISATQIRRAKFGDAFVRDSNGTWLRLDKAKFTASGADWEAKDTIDAGVSGGDFYLQTGGETTTHAPLGSIIQRLQ